VKKELLFFVLKLSLCLLFVFGLHAFVLYKMNLEPNYQLFVSAYVINFLMAFLIVGIISIYINKLKTYIGFLFMLGSFLKFAVFFIWFYPICKADGSVDGYEFSIFFVPYLVSLIFETLYLKKVLDKT